MVILILAAVHLALFYALGAWVGWWAYILSGLMLLGFIGRLPTYRRAASTNPLAAQLLVSASLNSVIWIVAPALGRTFGWDWMN